MTDGPAVGDLIERLDALLLALRKAVDDDVTRLSGDIVETDALYVATGHIDAALRTAAEHIEAVRSRLEEGERA